MYFKPRYGYLVEDVLTTRISFLSVLVSDMFNIGFVMGFVCGRAEKWLGSPQGEYKSSCPVQKGEYISSTERGSRSRCFLRSVWLRVIFPHMSLKYPTFVCVLVRSLFLGFSYWIVLWSHIRACEELMWGRGKRLFVWGDSVPDSLHNSSLF